MSLKSSASSTRSSSLSARARRWLPSTPTPKKKSSPPNPKRKTTTTSDGWEAAFAVLRRHAQAFPSPSLNTLTDTGSTPWQILAATILSLRTKDQVTLDASRRLFAVAPDPAATRRLDEETVAKLIFPAGFYKTKARQLKAIAASLAERHDELPRTRDELLAFPGVGRKTANLVLNLAFGIDAICVDTHVHRIPNRLGWIATKTPEESEIALEALWPRRHWIEANALLVLFGQTVCLPVSPRCFQCPLAPGCARVGVIRAR
jgi:endonuclease-3